MPELARLVHDPLELVELALEDLLGDGRRVEQDLDRRHAALAVLGADQALRHDGAQVGRQVHQQLRPALFREEVDDAFHRLRRAVGVQRAQAQVAGFGEGDRVLHRLRVADLADQDDVGRLAQGVLQRVVPRMGVDADFAVRHQRLLRDVRVLDRIFDVMMWPAEVRLRWSIIAASEVDLPEPGAADHEHQAALLHHHVLEDSRQAQLLEVRDFRGDRAQAPCRRCPAARTR
jgi:hypothetical protein